MPSRNERRIRAGYELFLASRPDAAEDWGPDAPVAALMDEHIEWVDETLGETFRSRGDGRSEDWERQPRTVLSRLRQLRSQMCCQIVSCLEDQTDENVVHTVDHALRLDGDGMRPHFCATRFEFGGEAGKVVRVYYCAGDVALDVRQDPKSGASAS